MYYFYEKQQTGIGLSHNIRYILYRYHLAEHIIKQGKPAQK